METCKVLVDLACRLFVCTVVSVVTGCATVPPVARFKSETELAVAATKTEWLKRCEIPGSLAGGMPDNNVGSLLQDYADMTSAFAECRLRYNSLIDYIEPIVKKEREGSGK